MTPQKYKDKTIAACRELVKKYRNPEGKNFFSCKDCPFCLIYSNCTGCINSRFKDIDKRALGCATQYWTFRIATRLHELKIKKFNLSGFEIRARFHELAIPILKKIDAQYFTPEGWKYEAFEAIRELDRKLAEGVIK